MISTSRIVSAKVKKRYLLTFCTLKHPLSNELPIACFHEKRLFTIFSTNYTDIGCLLDINKILMVEDLLKILNSFFVKIYGEQYQVH